jgi:phenylacetate-CoA ligase
MARPILQKETSLSRSLYNRSPVFVQNAFASIYGWAKNRFRYTRDTQQWEAFYRQAATWPKDRLRAYQLERLRLALRNAVDHVPFYRDRFAEAGLSPEDIRSLDDMQQLPLLDKSTIREQGQQLISNEVDPARLFAHPTSGSTGMPMTLYHDRATSNHKYAYVWARMRPGLDRSMRHANFTGLELIPPDQNRPPYWRMNHATGQRLYSVFHMNDQTLPGYVEDLRRFQPDWIYGYPSAIYLLAEFMLRKGIEFGRPVLAVITSAEQCLPEFRQAIEAAFHTKLWDEYGQGEMTAMAFECSCGYLHECVDFCAMEFIDTGQREGKKLVCEIVGTNYCNHAWPLIRYAPGDLALIDPEATCPYHRPGRLIETIYGRTAHFLLAKDGTRFPNISVIAKKCRHLKGLQCVQDHAGRVTLRAVPADDYDRAADEPHMIEQFRKKFGGPERMDIDVEYADDLLRTSSGKVLMIVSRLSDEQKAAATPTA